MFIFRKAGGFIGRNCRWGVMGKNVFSDRMNQAVRALSLLLPDGEEIACYKDPR